MTATVTPTDVMQDAYLAWTRGGDETLRFPDFAAWALYRLACYGFEVSR